MVVSSVGAHSNSVECAAFKASSRQDSWKAATGGMDKKLIIWINIHRLIAYVTMRFAALFLFSFCLNVADLTGTKKLQSQVLIGQKGSGPYVVIDKRMKADTDARETSSDDGNSDSDDAATNYDSGNQDDPAANKSTEEGANGNNAFAPENEQAEKTTDGACSTLFIANLGPNCTEEELKQVLSQYQGFNILKVCARGGMPIAFADFERVEQVTDAMNALQGSTLPSSDQGGMHTENARSKMRKP